MKYNGNINYIKCLEFGLNLSQGAVMDLLTHLSSWADGKEIEGEIFFYLSTQKMIEELPLISKTRGTFLKILQILKEKGLINHQLINNRSWYNLTKKGKSFVSKVFDEKYQKEEEKQGVENFTHSKENVEKNIHKCVKNYTQGVEKITHNNNTSNNNYKNNNNYNGNYNYRENGNFHIFKNFESGEITNKKSFLFFFKKEILENVEFIEKLKNKFNLENEDLKSFAENFILYWTEKNPNGKKEKWEMEKIFDIQRRFYRWLGNNKKWNKKPNKKQTHSYESVF